MYDASVVGSREKGRQPEMVSCHKLCFIAGLFAALLSGVSLGADRSGDDVSKEALKAPIPVNKVVAWVPTLETGGRSEGSHAPVAQHDCRLPGEFEHQGALLLACGELISTDPELIVELVLRTQGRVDIVALVSNVEEYEAVSRLLRTRVISQKHIHFVELRHDTMWTRDYGPTIVSKEGRAIVIDAEYDLSRGNDDLVPDQLAQLLNLDLVRMPLRLDGGNLISNGNGLALTTHRLFAENSAEDDMDAMCTAIGQGYGIREVAILEPLAGEATGHVDMFATFTSENTVVVGKFDPEIDAENAAILNRNADHLSTILTAHGALRVIRIPMPSNNDGIWRTYTNVIFANGALLVPTYADANKEQQTLALSTYAKLMPGWKIVGIDAGRIIVLNGALHCITMNLGPLGHIPDFPEPHTNARDQIDFGDESRGSLADLESEHPALTWTRTATTPTRYSNRYLRDTSRAEMLNRRRLRWQDIRRARFEKEADNAEFSRRARFLPARPFAN